MRARLPFVRLFCFVSILSTTLPGRSTAAEPVDFAQDVLPILSAKCFVCHGPDTKKKGLLRLDSFEGATRDLGGRRGIDPITPEKSEVLVRLHDREDPMPPADAEAQLTDAERALLSRWVREGGKYAEHWSFVRPWKAALPTVSGEVRGAIDAFLLAKLESRGLSFAPEADPSTLARRAALVLTGLPPEPEQLERFLSDESPEAYERLVDELLASPRFGEHQARYWLDAVRYGDTHGLHLDNRRGIYPYRDWLVHAINENLPLDDFITWQLAGDLLERPSLEQLVATGFVRMNPTTSEGGALPEEFQAKNNFDRTETLGTVLLGMTLTCARCHTHKYDPVPQEEYYRLLAFFNSTAESSMDGNSYTYGPVVEAPASVEAWRVWSELEEERARLLGRVESASGDTARLVDHARELSGWSVSGIRSSEPVSKELPEPAGSASPVKGLPGTSDQRLPGADQAIWLACDVESPREQTLWLDASGGEGSQLLVGDVPVSIEAGASDGSRISRLPVSIPAGRTTLRVKMAGTPRETRVEFRLSSPWDALASSGSWANCDPEARLATLTDSRGPLASLGLQVEASQLARRIDEAKASFTTTLVARDLPTPRETRVLRRGEYNLPAGEPLEPGIISVMGAFPEGAPTNRLGLARWLTSPEHPLVTRVLVNRLWQIVFGEGLVRTPEDFGLQGEQPTHPKLLDWLAVDLVERGWDRKSALRQMVLSRAFRQSSAWRRDVDDPENRLLARGPRFRLDAEVIRDTGLWASRLLDPEMGGEGVKPYQPDGMWFALAHPASNTKRYVRDRGERLYRRSLYVYWKRTSPHPMMTLFDAPSRESSCVRRSRTNTAAQSLGLLNETQRVEMSRKLAERLLLEAALDAARIDRLFRLLACRDATVAERQACEGLLSTLRARYRDHEADAVALLATGDAPRRAELEPVEVAAWTQLVATVLASDAVILLY